MEKYKYKTKSKSDMILHVLDGERVNLAGGSVEILLPSTRKRPAQKAIVRGITDADVEKMLSNPAKYGDWSEKFIDLKTGFTVGFTRPVVGTMKEPVKKNAVAEKPAKSKPAKAKAKPDKKAESVKSEPAKSEDKTSKAESDKENEK